VSGGGLVAGTLVSLANLEPNSETIWHGDSAVISSDAEFNA
jgi:hypothetical protein